MIKGSQLSRRGWILMHFKLTQEFKVVLVTYKNEEDPIKNEEDPITNEEDPIKNEGARVVTTYYFDISDSQGQPSPYLVVKFIRNSNSSMLVYLSFLHARKKRVQSKMNALEWSQHFFHHKSK